MLINRFSGRSDLLDQTGANVDRIVVGPASTMRARKTANSADRPMSISESGTGRAVRYCGTLAGAPFAPKATVTRARRHR